MHVKIIDQTNGKLLLFLPALSALQATDVTISFESKQQILLGEWKRFSDKIVLAEKGQREDVRILLTDTSAVGVKVPEIPTIIYPLWPQTESASWSTTKERNPFRVPLGSLKLMGHRLGDVPSLLDALFFFQSEHPLQGRRFLITAGPTAEDLDPVRYLTNRSSGKMGVALARAAFVLGADVLLVMGPGSASFPAYLSPVRVRSASEMAHAVLENFDDCHVYIGAAAVADFTPAETSTEKIKKKEGQMYLPLKRTVDILEMLGRKRQQQILVGFSVETENVLENSLQKLRRKNLDLIIVNNPKEKGAAFETETNKVTVVEKNGRRHEWPLMSKFELSLKIMHLLAEDFLK